MLGPANEVNTPRGAFVAKLKPCTCAGWLLLRPAGSRVDDLRAQVNGPDVIARFSPNRLPSKKRRLRGAARRDIK